MHVTCEITGDVIIIIIIIREWPCPDRLSIFDVCFYRAFIRLLFVESCFTSAQKLSLVCCTRWLRYFVVSRSVKIVLTPAASRRVVPRPFYSQLSFSRFLSGLLYISGAHGCRCLSLIHAPGGFCQLLGSFGGLIGVGCGPRPLRRESRE